MTQALPSYSSGTSSVPLLGDTIGDNLARTVARFPDREALVDVPDRAAAGPTPSWTPTWTRWPGGCSRTGVAKGDRVGIWSPNCAGVGAAAVRHGEDRRDPGQRQPGLPQPRAGLRGQPVRHAAAGQRRRAQELGLPRDGRAGARRVPGADRRRVHRRAELGRPRRPRRRTSTPSGWRERMAALDTDDPINIQYTSGTTGFPKGATLTHHNILNNGYFVGELVGYTEQDRICLPVPFYHCFGMVMGNLAATSHGACMVIPAPSFDPVATLRAVQQERCTALYGVPTMFIAELGLADFASYDLCTPAHRHHGRLAVPGGGDEAGGRRDAHVRGGHLLRHDRDLAGVHDDPRGRRPGPAHRDRRPGHAAPGGQGRRPGHRADRPARRAGRAVHPRLQRDARLLGRSRTRPPRRSTRRAGCTPATWPRWTPTATSTSSAGSRTWSSAAGRTSTRARSRSSSTPTRTIADVQVVGVPDERYGEELMAWVVMRPGHEPLTVEDVRDVLPRPAGALQGPALRPRRRRASR